MQKKKILNIRKLKSLPYIQWLYIIIIIIITIIIIIIIKETYRNCVMNGVGIEKG